MLLSENEVSTLSSLVTKVAGQMGSATSEDIDLAVEHGYVTREFSRGSPQQVIVLTKVGRAIVSAQEKAAKM